MVMTLSRISSLLQRGALAAAILAPAFVPAAVIAQDRSAYEPPYADSAPRRNRVKRDDAYRPTDDGAGLGTLSSSGATDAGSYPPPSNVAQGYGSPGSVPPPPYGAGAYGSSPPPPSGSNPYSSPDYGSAPPSRPYPPAGPAANDGYRPQPYGASANDAYRPPQGGGGYSPAPYDPPPSSGGFGQPYSPPPGDGYQSGPRRPYMSGEDNARPPYRDERRDGTYSSNEILAAGHGFFGSISQGLASVIEYAFKRQGRPNGYILGEDAGGAFVAGLRYGEGRLYTKDAGTHRVYWQGPSLGYDVGAAGSKVMVLVYNLRDPAEIYERFGGVDGSAYVVGGIGMTFQKRDHIVLAPIRAGVGLRLGANVGYLKYTPTPTWNPF